MRSLLIAAAAVALAASPAQAQDPHAGHKMPAQAVDPHAGHKMPAPDPHAGHVMPKPAADPHAGHAMAGAQLPVGDALAPNPPTDRLADAIWGAAPMDAARAVLRLEHGGMTLSRTMVEMLELRPASGRDAYAWEGEFRYGGDIHRLVLKTEGEGAGADLESAEVQALYSRAVGPYFDLQAGVRQDIQPRPRRTYLTAGLEGLAPYWFEVEGAMFLADTGDVLARFEASYDLRLTQRLILEPRAELNLAAQDTARLGVGSGLSDAEVGLRLRYEIRREFAPYVGVHYERSFGATADYARAAGDARDDLSIVVGLRAWF